MDEIYKKYFTGSIDKLLLLSKKKGLDLSYTDIKQYLKKKEANQLLKEVRKPKSFNSVYAYSIRDSYQMDIMIYDRYEIYKYKYILNIIDVYSRYAYSVPLTNMREETLLKEIEKAFDILGVPKNINCDLQFNSKNLNDYFNKKKINLYFSQRDEPYKNAVIERFNRTLAKMIMRWREISGRRDWNNALSDIVKSYNSMKHSTTKEAPKDIWNGKAINKQEINFVKNTFEINDIVRIKRYKKVFDKGDTLTYSRDTYKIIDKNKNKLKLINMKTNEELKTLYKPYEIIKVDEIEVMKDNKAEENEKITQQEQQEKKVKKNLKRDGVDTSNIITEKRNRKPVNYKE